jgi:hypothetical protein
MLLAGTVTHDDKNGRRRRFSESVALVAKDVMIGPI